MSKSLLALVFISLFTLTVTAQEETAKNKEVDSLQTDLAEEGIIVVDTLKKERVKINPLAPSKAAFLSAIIPGLGQVYNKRYWKVPIVYGAIGAAVYGYTWNNNNYQRFRTAFKRRRAGFTDDEFYANPTNPSNVPLLGLDDLQSQQERFQNDRDLLLLVSIALYALNIVDANVDAHLKQFNIDDDLSFDMEPFLDLDPVTNNPNYGMALIIKF
ncbi:DUF5683 domain-containing protein [uncultured Zobellia sp.]|uniref:DUF5683 domain-containing protein n=1 Tax=uncultured Zobellia sp. TaxID=255433 RepID=UPI002594C5C0|nr:DUF5683 domain-containing protein [uncultured Zobellia sp.]